MLTRDSEYHPLLIARANEIDPRRTVAMADAESALSAELDALQASRRGSVALDAESHEDLLNTIRLRRTRVEEQAVLDLLQDDCTATSRLEMLYANRRLLAVVMQHEELLSLTRAQIAYVQETGLYVSRGLR